MKAKNNIQKPEEDLLNDEFFIQSMLNPSPDTDNLWNSLAEDDMADRERLDESREFMEIVQHPGKIMTNKEINDIWTNIEIRNKQNLRGRIRRRNYYLLGAAATILLLIVSILFVRFTETEEVQDIMAIAGEMVIAAPDESNIRLITSGGDAVELEDKSAEITLNEEGKISVNDELLTQNSTTNSGKSEASYNQLIIPRGTRSRLTLSDGTTMHINSGSQVVFPERFTGKKREIFVEGEVFLDVTPNTEMPFVVRTNKMNIEVLGTSFNVSAYNDEVRQTVVLVSGSVSVRTDNNRKAELKPSQMLTYTNEECVVSRIDVTSYIAWKDGLLIADNNESVSSLVRKLARFYGKSITCDTSLDAYYGNGKLDLIGSFDEILNDLTAIYPIEIFRNGEDYFVKRKQ